LVPFTQQYVSIWYVPPSPDAPGEPESLATIRCGISSAQPNVSEASVRPGR
jgi:hypothetical protein